MANNIDVKSLNNNLKTLSTSSGSKYNLTDSVFKQIKQDGIKSSASGVNSKLNTLSKESSDDANNIVKQCQNEDLYLTPRDQIISGSGFDFKEINPPKQNKNTPNNSAQPNAPSFPLPLARGVVCGTSKGNANLDFSFNCNFVAGINLDSCLFKFQKEIKIYMTKITKYAFSLVRDLFPATSWLQGKIKNFCEMFNQLQKIICFIQQLLSCIMNTISAIINIINWIMTLPIRILQSLIQCVTSFFGNIIGSISSMSGALITSIASIFGCQSFNCPSIKDIGDITDLSNVSTDFGTSAGKFVGTIKE